MKPGRIFVAREDDLWIIRMEGDLRFTLSPALNQFLDQRLAQADNNRFLVDLCGAESIDSTNLGVLARIARHAREENLPSPVILSSNESITELLRGICFDQLFTLVPQASDHSDGLTELDPLEAEEEKMLGLVLDAHRRLSDLDEGNREQFRELVEALEQEGS